MYCLRVNLFNLSDIQEKEEDKEHYRDKEKKKKKEKVVSETKKKIFKKSFDIDFMDKTTNEAIASMRKIRYFKHLKSQY